MVKRIRLNMETTLIVAKEAPLRCRNKVEFEDGEKSTGDERENDAANHVSTAGAHPFHGHGGDENNWE